MAAALSFVDAPNLNPTLTCKIGSCPVLGGRGAASSGGHGDAKAVAAGWLRRGGHTDLYVTKPAKALPKWVGAGDVLVGSLALDDQKKAVTKLPLAYEAPPQPIQVRCVPLHPVVSRCGGKASVVSESFAC